MSSSQITCDMTGCERIAVNHISSAVLNKKSFKQPDLEIKKIKLHNELNLNLIRWGASGNFQILPKIVN